MKDGKQLDLKIYKTKFKQGFLNELIWKDESGEKQVILASNIASMRALPVNVVQQEGIDLSDIRALSDVDAAFAGYGIFEQKILPGKKQTPALMQLLNPDFCQHIRIYQEPKAVKNAEAAVIDGEEVEESKVVATYYIEMNDKLVELKKWDYKKEFGNLFGDCSELMEILENKQAVWVDFPQHVWQYEQNCQSSN